MLDDTALILPQNPSAVTADVVDAWYKWYQAMAEKQVEDLGLTGKQREYEVTKRMLELCSAADTVNEAIKVQVIERIADQHLYTCDGIGSLGDAIRDIIPTVKSAGYSWGLEKVAGTILPYAKRIGVNIHEKPLAISSLVEAASYLGNVIADPELSEPKREEIVREELAFVLNAENKEEVRSRYHKWRGIPANGSRVKIDEDEEVLLFVGKPITITAIVHRIDSRMIHWRGGKAKIRQGTLRPSKGKKGQQVRTDKILALMERMYIFDATTGELVEEIEC